MQNQLYFYTIAMNNPKIKKNNFIYNNFQKNKILRNTSKFNTTNLILLY